MNTTTAIPATLVAAFSEGVATTYWQSYLHVTRHRDGAVDHALLAVINGLLDRMRQRNCPAYEACSQILPQLESDLSKRMAMAAAVVIARCELRPGTPLNELPTLPLE